MTLEKYREEVKQEKQTAALDAAVGLFLENGYDRTSLIQVAKAANISTGTLFKHFPTKAVLFGAVMQRMWEADAERSRPVPPVNDPAKGLYTLGRDYASVLGQPTTLPLFRVIMAEAPRFPELGQSLFDFGKKPFLHRVHNYLAAEMKAGTLSIEDVPLAASQFLGMISDSIFGPGFFEEPQNFN